MRFSCFFNFHKFHNTNKHHVIVSVLSNIRLGKNKLSLTFKHLAFVGRYTVCDDCDKLTARTINYGTEVLTKEVEIDLRPFKKGHSQDILNKAFSHFVDLATSNEQFTKTQLDALVRKTFDDERLISAIYDDRKGLTAHDESIAVYHSHPTSDVITYIPVDDPNVEELRSALREHENLKRILLIVVAQFLLTEGE